MNFPKDYQKFNDEVKTIQIFWRKINTLLSQYYSDADWKIINLKRLFPLNNDINNLYFFYFDFKQAVQLAAINNEMLILRLYRVMNQGTVLSLQRASLQLYYETELDLLVRYSKNYTCYNYVKKQIIAIIPLLQYITATYNNIIMRINGNANVKLESQVKLEKIEPTYETNPEYYKFTFTDQYEFENEV